LVLTKPEGPVVAVNGLLGRDPAEVKAQILNELSTFAAELKKKGSKKLLKAILH
jgi:hypothetical protein